MKRFFVGGPPELDDITYVACPKDFHVLLQCVHFAGSGSDVWYIILGHSPQPVWVQDRDIWLCSAQVESHSPEPVSSMNYILPCSDFRCLSCTTRSCIRNPEDQSSQEK